MSAWPAPSASAVLLLAPPATATMVATLPPPAAATTSVAAPAAPVERARPPERTTAGLVASMILRFVALAWCWLLIWGLLWSFVPAIVGWTPTVVRSGSMEPSLSVGDVIHIDGSVDLDRLGVGSVITFEDPGVPDMRVTHRVTGVERVDGAVVGYRTKGDANEAADSTIVPVENVHGAGRLIVPWAGLPRVWASDGRWIHLSTFIMVTIAAAVLSGDTIQQYLSGRTRRRKRKRVAAIAVAVAAMLGAPSTTAAFNTTTDNPANAFTMTPQWFLDTIDRDTPVAHWRLGELAGAPVTVLADDFETFTGWTPYGSGDFVSSTAEARSGVQSGRSSGKNEPGGAWKVLPAPVGGSVVLDTWVWRKGKGANAVDRVGLADATFSGYGIRAEHLANVLQIDRRTAGVPTAIGTAVAFDPPEKAWYRLQLVVQNGTVVANAYNGAGTLLATTSAVDSTTTSFDRALVYNGDKYHVDDLTVVQNLPPTVAADRTGTLDGTYTGFPTPGLPGLVSGQPDTAIGFDGVDDAVLIGDSASINLTPRATRTAELWFRADVLAGRRVLYEEGGSTDGMNIYLDGPMLYATAWSTTTGWSNPLVTSIPVAPLATYHVAVTLDAVGTRSLVLYLDGSPVSTATKTDGNLWAAHPDDGAVGYLNGSTRFHDGPAAGTGSFAFDGTIDEVVLFNGVVPAANIANHYAAGA